MRRLLTIPLVLTALVLACGGPARTPLAPARAISAGAGTLPAPAPPGAATSVWLPEGITPLGYDLSLKVDPRKDGFSGAVAITIRVDEPAASIVLHGRKLAIEVARVDGKATRVVARMAFGGKEDPEELVLVPDAPVPRGEHTLYFVYSAPFNRQLRGLYKVVQGGQSWAFTQLEAADARRMFPCFDEPRYKTPFAIRVEVPRGMLAVSNGLQTAARDAGETTSYEFAPTLALPTYLVALAAGNLEIAEGPKTPVPVRIVTTPGKSKLGVLAMEAAEAYLGVLGDYFARPYPYGKLDLVAVPDFAPGAMENAGLVTFREELLLLDPAHAPLAMRRRMEAVMAHELAHQWVGNLVTMRWWDDVWLNEGFATWMGSKALDLRRPSFGARREMAGSHWAVMALDARPSARPVRVPVPTSDAILESGGWTAYVKGDGVLDMLEAHVGADAMRTALRHYVSLHAFGAVTTGDFVAAIADSTKKPGAAPLARSFLDQPGMPVVGAALECDTNGARVRLTQSALRTTRGENEAVGRSGTGAPKSASDPRRWTIPVCISYEGAARPACTMLDGEKADVALARCPAWVMPNAGATGWYRWALEPKLFRALAKVAPTLGEKERAALPSNAWAMLETGSIGAGDFFEALDRLSPGKDASRLVLEQTIAVLERAREALVDDRSSAAFGAFVRTLLRPALARLGEDPGPKDDDDRRLGRVSVTAALYDLAGDPGVAATAEKRAAAWLKDPASVDPDLGALALRISARAGGVATWDALSSRLDAAGASEHVALVLALASPADPARLVKTLDLVLSGRVRAGDFRYVQVAAARQPDLRSAFLGWMMEHMGELAHKLGSAAGLAGTVGFACEPGQQARVAAFFRERLAKLEGAQRSFEEGMEQSAECIRTRGAERENARKWLGRR